MRRIIGTGMGLVAMAAGPALAQSTVAQSAAPTASDAAHPAAVSAAAASAPTTTVVVTAKAPTVVHKIDRTVYDLKDNAQATTGSVSDVLGTLPSVNVDSSGNVSVRGGSVQVVVDGKPSPALKGANLAQALQAMPANTVARIEVITNPGPEFRSNAPTVINIVTKHTNNQAPTGDLIVNIGDSARYNGTLSGSVGVGPWTFTGALSLRQDRRENSGHVDRISRNPDGSVATHMVEALMGRNHNNPTSLDLGASYAAGDNDTLSLASNVSVRPRARLSDDHIVFVDPISVATLSDTDTTSGGPNHYNSSSLTGTWKHKGGRDGETLTVQGRHEEDDFLQDARYYETSAIPAIPETAYRELLTQRQLTDALSGDYVLPLGTDIQFKTGFDTEVARTTTYSLDSDINVATGAQTPRTTGNSQYLIDQTLSAGYVDYQHPLGKWLAEGGLRVENMLTRIRYGRTAPLITTSNVQWSPSFYLSRELTPQSKLKFSYSHRIDRPNSDQLFGLQQVLDAQDVYTGNPYLKPAETESFEAGYDYTTHPVSFSGTAYLRQTRNTIVDYAYYAHPGDTVLISTVENAGTGSISGLDMSLDLHVIPKIDLSFSSNVFHKMQTAPVSGVDTRQSVTSAQNKVTATFNPTKADSLQVQVQANGRDLMAEGYSDSQPFINLTYTHKISPKLKLVMTDINASNSMRYHQVISAPQYRDNTVFKGRGSIFYVGLDYKLGAAPGGG